MVGCLLEKQLATPGSYPLTVNALVAACNQTSNRFPVVAYDEATVEQALRTLREKGVTRIVYSPQNRAPKHRHVLDEVLEVDMRDLAVLAVLLLRGPQTPGELRARTERLAAFGRLEEVDEVLERLASRAEPLVVRLERQPGQKEARYAHLLAGEPSTDWSHLIGPPVSTAGQSADDDGTRQPGERSGEVATSERLAALEAEVAALRAEMRRLQEELGMAPAETRSQLDDEVHY